MRVTLSSFDQPRPESLSSLSSPCQVRGSGTAARRALFEAERGVCQLCSLDAHSLFVNVKALQVRDRPAYLAETPYASLPEKTLKKMVMEPQEGMVRMIIDCTAYYAASILRRLEEYLFDAKKGDQ